MNPASLTRAPEKVHQAIRQMEDGRLVALKPCRIYSPARYAEQNLSYIGAEIYILGIFAIVVGDDYGVCLLNTMVPIEPSAMRKIKIEGDDYYEFSFNEGATIVKTIHLVKTDTLVYRIYEEFIAKGYVPWYMGYVEMGQLFDTAKEFAGANIGTNREVTQLIASIVARDPNERTRYYRQVIQTPEDLQRIKPAFVPLKSVAYSATNTLTKLGGAYFQDGVVSSLINPSTRVERIESILRC